MSDAPTGPSGVRVSPIPRWRDSSYQPSRHTPGKVPAGSEGAHAPAPALNPAIQPPGSWTKDFRGLPGRHAWKGGGVCGEGTGRACAVAQAAALARSWEMAAAAAAGRACESRPGRRPGPSATRPRPPACPPWAARPAWRAALATGRCRPEASARPGPRCREAAFSTGRRTLRRRAGARATAGPSGPGPGPGGGPGQVSARHSSRGREQEGAGVCSPEAESQCRGPRPCGLVWTARSDVRSHLQTAGLRGWHEGEGGPATRPSTFTAALPQCKARC